MNRISVEEKERYMRRAMQLAGQGLGWTDPNPMVGCVVVKDGRIVAEGYHHRCGEYHAERNALLSVTEDVRGADLYVTLEPCCHHGKTPPCTDIILEKGIGRVFVGAVDTNPLVGGRGIRILRERGIYVETGILEEECRRQNEVFFHWIEKKRPFVAMKYAMTLDGKIACATGDSRWVTGEEARRHVHLLRHRYRGIMVGIGTVLADDPMLNARLTKADVEQEWGGEQGIRQPVRIVCDSTLRIPMDSTLVKTARDIPVIVFRAADIPEKRRAEIRVKEQRLKEQGVTVLTTDGAKVDPGQMLELLRGCGIDSVLLEGGGTLNASFLEAGLVDRVYAYAAPKLVGGVDARTPVEGSGIPRMGDAVKLTEVSVSLLGEDILITGRCQEAKNTQIG